MAMPPMPARRSARHDRGVEALRQDWADVQAKAVTIGAEESFRLHTAYIERVRDFITSIADRPMRRSTLSSKPSI
jgi:hypothetical protein